MKGETVAEIILHPTHPDYCKECIYSTPSGCSNTDYQKNSYYVNCVWGYCKYKKVREKNGEIDTDKR